MKIEAGVKVRNVFNFQVRDKDTGAIKETYQAFNTVTEELLRMLVSDGYFLNYIHFGTGTGTTSPSDVALFTHLGYKVANGPSPTVFDYELPLLSVTKNIRLNAEEYVGARITEVGFSGSSASTSGLQTHALIVDSEGAPISIVKSATDIIDIYATVFFDVSDPSGDLAGAAYWRKYSNDIDGVKPTGYAMLVQSWENRCTVHTEQPVNWEYSGPWKLDTIESKSMIRTYDLEKKLRIYNLRFSETEANGPIRGITFNNILSLDVTKANTIWGGKTFNNSTVGTGNGVATGFNLKKPDVKDLSITIDGAVVPESNYKYTPNISTEFVSSFTGFGDLPDFVNKHIERVTMHPSNNGVFMFTVHLDSTIYVAKLDPATLKVTILDSKAYPLPHMNPSFSDYYNIGFVADGDAMYYSRGGDYNGIRIFSFNAETGKIGEQWTAHPNLPVYPPFTDYPFYNTARLTPIEGSNFVIRSFDRQTGAGLPNNQKIITMSLNKTTKTYGENINNVDLSAVGIGEDYMILVNPVFDVVLIKGPGTAGVYPIERATGVIGTPKETFSMNNYASSWSPNGRALFYSGTTNMLFDYDNATQILTPRAGWATSNALSLYQVTKVFYITDEIILALTNGNLYQAGLIGNTLVRHGEYAAPDIPIIFGDRILHFRNYKNVSKPFLSMSTLRKVAQNHITFVTPPADGAVIKANFHVDYIPKDKDHILDLEIVYAFTGG